MAHPLDGARLKIVRAKQHLESFNEEAFRYVNTKPCKVVSKIEGDYVGIEGVVTSQPPPAFACIVGDFVTNLRAALDYIAWEIAMRRGCGRTLAESKQRKITFPIYETNAKFAGSNSSATFLRDICAVPTEAMDVIESVQPYHAGYESIRRLNDLVRIDKHQTILLCGTYMGDVGNIAIYRNNELAWTAYGTGAGFGTTRFKGNLAAAGEPTGHAAEYRVEMDGEPSVYISLKDFPSPGETTWVGLLQQILECVANVVPSFDPFFL